MAFEGQEIFYTDQSLLPDNQQEEQRGSVILKRFEHFLREWKVKKQYYYREQLIRNVNLQKNFIEVDIEDIKNHDEELAESLLKSPLQTHPLLESAAQ